MAPEWWRTPEELAAIGFERSRVVMMNEAHAGLLRCVRTREVGKRVLPAAHEAGARYLAMEALFGDIAERANETRALPSVSGGYLAQPEMRALIEKALALGWTLIAYESPWPPPGGLEPDSTEASNWREEQQARNLVAALEALPGDARMLVWSGNGHPAKRGLDGWRPMGVWFGELSEMEAFAIDQTRTVAFPGVTQYAMRWVDAYANEIAIRGGAAGFLAGDAPPGWTFPESADAFIVSSDNAMS